MPCPRLHIRLLAAVLSLAGWTGGAYAASFPEIKTSERELTSVPEHPNAPAAVLFRKGEFNVVEGMGVYSPHLIVQVRRKILTEEGKRYGEISFHHNKHVKLAWFEGRTVLPNGQEVRLPKDAIFKRRVSKREKQFVTSVTFPRVEVGAILDYQYEIELGSTHFLEPWSFQEEIPTLYSEILYRLPREYIFRIALFDPLKTGIRQHKEDIGGGWAKLFLWGKNLPALPDEPYGVPSRDLESRVLLIPLEVINPRPHKSYELFNTWANACALYADSYEKSLSKAGESGSKAREMAAAAPNGGRPEKAEAVYRFVRDGIQTVEDPGVGLPRDSTTGEVFAARRGDYAEKAVLLQAMLGALEIPSRLVWVGERSRGTIHPDVITSSWFERVIVAAELDDRRVFLDPSDRNLAFGRLAPGLEGMPALLFDRVNPELLTLPSSPFEENLRKATVDLDLDAAGRLSGRGALRLTGNRAWTRLGWKENAGESAKVWQEWLSGEYTDFDITDVKVAEAVEETRVEVTWAMAQRKDEALGDEATLNLSRPLGPVKQPFVSPAASRISPILFDFAGRDEAEVTVRWPEGWAPEALPDDKDQESSVGAFKARLDLDTAGRRATFHRRLDVKDRQFEKKLYNALQSLFGQAERSDAQVFVLTRR